MSMGLEEALGILDDWLNFFDLCPQEYGHLRYSLQHLDLNQLFIWKFFAATLVLTFGVFVPCVWLPWGGFTTDGHEHAPALLLLGVITGVLSTISLLLAAFGAYRRGEMSQVVVRLRVRAWSLEMLDWVLYQVSTTATVVAFLTFWLIIVPAEISRLSPLRIQGVLFQGLVVGVDFYLTSPRFRKSHVFLAFLWPSGWILGQWLRVSSGHQPTVVALDFHTWHSPLTALCHLLFTAGAFHGLLRTSERLRTRTTTETSKQPKPATAAPPSSLTLTPSSGNGPADQPHDGELPMDTNPRSSVANYALLCSGSGLRLVASAVGLNVKTALESASTADPTSDVESGVYRIGSNGSVASDADDSHIIAIGAIPTDSQCDGHNHR